jgi:hypothetical protein
MNISTCVVQAQEANMSDLLKPGDTVQLLAGGPIMTIESFVIDDDIEKAVCLRTRNNMTIRERYALCVLKKTGQTSTGAMSA